jgi:hypothetical protein
MCTANCQVSAVKRTKTSVLEEKLVSNLYGRVIALYLVKDMPPTCVCVTLLSSFVS